MNSELLFLLSDDDKKTLSEHIATNGYDSLKNLLDIIHKNSMIEDYTLLDVDILITFDLRTNYKIFITENEIMTRDMIIEKYKLSRFKLEPEQLFNHQKIKVCDTDYIIFDEECEESGLLNNNTNLYNTKVYIGKEKWKDFMITFRFMRSLTFISETRLAITESEKNDTLINKESIKNKESEYIDKVLEQVLHNGI